VKELYYVNYKILMKDTEKTHTQTGSHVHGLEESTLLISLQHKEIYRFNAKSIKISMTFLTEVEKRTLFKFIWSHKKKKTKLAKGILRKKNKARRIIYHLTSKRYKAILIKTSWSWPTNRPITQWNPH
jgi:hypothetical protein